MIKEQVTCSSIW